MLKKISLLLITSFLLSVIFFFIYKKNIPKKDEIKIGNRNIQKVKFSKHLSKNFKDQPYRIYQMEDSIIILVDTTLYIFNKDLNFSREGKFLSNTKAGNFYYSRTQKGIVNFNALENTLFFFENSKLKTYKKEDFIMNSLWFDSLFFTYTFNKKNFLSIDSWNPYTNKYEVKYNISTILKDTLLLKDCLMETLDGNFFKIDNKNIGFYFYRSGKFLLLNKDNIRLINSIVKSSFIKFYKKEITTENGDKLTICEAVNDNFIQIGACSSNNRIYILSSVTNGNTGVIDIYFLNGVYEKSIEIPKFKNNKAPAGFLVIADFIYFIFQNDIVKYKVEGL